MPIRLVDLTLRTRVVTVEFGGESAQVLYRPNAITPDFLARLEETSVVEAVALLVDSWDVLGEGDQPVPVTASELAKIPLEFLRAVFNSVLVDSRAPKVSKLN